MDIVIRDIKQSDIKDLHNILLKAWYQDMENKNKEATDAYVQVDLNSCLNQSSFGKVAELNGKVVGVILGQAVSEPKHMRYFQSSGDEEVVTLMNASEELRKVIIDHADFEIKASKQLLEESSIDYDGSIELFAVLEEAQGTGIGGQLFEEMITYFKSHHVKSYQLFTDTACNYGFYEYKGLRRNGTIPYSNESNFKFYMYDYIFGKN